MASAILGSWVVLPEPVSPQTMTTWWASIAAVISSRLAETGRDSGKVMLRDDKTAQLKARDYPRSSLTLSANPSPPPMSTVFNFTFVPWFRSVAPYIHMHRGKTFVVGHRGRGHRGGQAAAHRAGPGADPEHGREDRAGARLPARRSTSSSRPRAMRPSTRTACASPTKWRWTARRKPPASCATRSRPPSARACPTRRWPAPPCA